MTILSSLFERVGEQLDGIIDAYRRGVTPPHPETIVEYANGSISSFNIEGELGQNSIPECRENAVKVEIGTAVTNIGNSAFSDCFSLVSVTIPDSVTSIGTYAFSGSLVLISITIPNSVTNIENYTFSNTALTSVTIPDSVTSIGTYAFSNTALTSVTISDNVTSIGDRAFFGCSKLKSVTIGNGVTSIGDWEFSECKNLSSITSFRTSAPSVKSYTFGSSSRNYTGRNTYSSGNNVLKVPTGATGYDASYWLDPLQSSTKCGFHIEYI